MNTAKQIKVTDHHEELDSATDNHEQLGSATNNCDTAG